jgi:hypothetical protein
MPAGSVVLSMQAVVFIGIQGSGKTSFYAERFLKTHVRISLDLLKTRGKEARFLQLCLDTGQKFVMDNTNPTVASRATYIEASVPGKRWYQLQASALRIKSCNYLQFMKALMTCLKCASRTGRSRCVLWKQEADVATAHGADFFKCPCFSRQHVRCFKIM